VLSYHTIDTRHVHHDCFQAASGMRRIRYDRDPNPNLTCNNERIPQKGQAQCVRYGDHAYGWKLCGDTHLCLSCIAERAAIKYSFAEMLSNLVDTLLGWSTKSQVSRTVRNYSILPLGIHGYLNESLFATSADLSTLRCFCTFTGDTSQTIGANTMGVSQQKIIYVGIRN
jgi:hypothetical protein